MPSALYSSNYSATANNILNKFDNSPIYDSATGAWTFKDNAGNSLISATTSAITLSKATTVSPGNVTNAGVNVRFNASNPTATLSYRCSNGDGYVGFNTLQVASSDNQTYAISSYAARQWMELGTGTYKIDVAASGTAGNTITWTNAVSFSSTGAVTFPTSTTHTFGNTSTAGATVVKALSKSGSDSILILQEGTSPIVFRNRGGALSIDDDVTLNKFMSISSAGAVTLGPTPSSAGASQLTTGSSSEATTLFRNTGADSSSVFVASRAGTNNGSESYIAFADGGTSAAPSERGTVRWEARVNSGNTAMEFGSVSDARLKNISGTFSGGLTKIINTPIRTYSWKHAPEKETYGLIAQELQQTCPDCVFEMESGNLGISGFSSPMFVMWNAIQELSAQLDAAKAEIAALKSA